MGCRRIGAERVANFILDVGTFLLASGAHCGRVSSNTKRMALAWGYKMDMEPSFIGLTVTVTNIENESDTITSFKASPPHSVHLEILTKVSSLSWKVIEQGLTLDQAELEFEKIKETPNYKPIVVSVAVGVACAGLCVFSFGDMKLDLMSPLIVWVAAFVGSMVRFFVSKKKFNQMLSIGIAAFVTTMITGLGSISGFGEHPEAAMATAVLYLIPGVPLLNCIIDLIDGALSSAMNRGLFAGFILLCIAVGMTLSITLLGLSNF